MNSGNLPVYTGMPNLISYFTRIFAIGTPASNGPLLHKLILWSLFYPFDIDGKPALTTCDSSCGK